MNPHDPIDWVVLGDDWGRHPSTTQHLVSRLPTTDHVTWVGSLGMRAPRFHVNDLRRIAGRVRDVLAGDDAGVSSTGRRPDAIIRPLVLPWHTDPMMVALNRKILKRHLRNALARPSFRVLLASTPVAALYAESIRADHILYLRLDDWPRLPGVDAALVRMTEPRMLKIADHVVVPNASLVPPTTGRARPVVLPQGVDLERFSSVPLEPPETRVLGYWGAIAPWLDVDLIIAVARRCRTWTFEFRGPVLRTAGEPGPMLARLQAEPNVTVLPPVSHDRLGSAAFQWRAAWAPFARGHHLVAASPLKLREYLAAGLPTLSTLGFDGLERDLVTVRHTPEDIAEWLLGPVGSDSADARAVRRASQEGQSWSRRAAELRALVRGGV